MSYSGAGFTDIWIETSPSWIFPPVAYSSQPVWGNGSRGCSHKKDSLNPIACPLGLVHTDWALLIFAAGV